MKKYIKYLSVSVIACVALTLSSCKDFLYPTSYNNLTSDSFYQTDDQITAALTSVYTVLRTSACGSNYFTNIQGGSDEEYYYNYNADRPNSYTTTATNSVVLALWTAYYGALKDISYLLWGLDENQGSLTESVYKNAKGEALFFRAYFHYLLASQWAHPSTGVPMYTDLVLTYEDTSMPISTPNVIYAQCIKDLQAAEELLEETGQTWATLGYSERVSLNTVRGYLQRVALTAAGFPNYGKLEDGTGGGSSATSLSEGQKYYFELARDYGLKVVAMGENTLVDNYEDVFITAATDGYTSESMFEIGYTFYGNESSYDDSNTAGPIGCNFGLTRRPYNSNGTYNYDSLVCLQYCYAHPRLIMSYGHGDDRRYWNAPEFSYETWTHVKLPQTTYMGTMVSDAAGGVDTGATWYYPSANLWNKSLGKWRREHESRDIYRTNSNSSTTNFPLLRYSDVLLMTAEAYIELGTPASAAQYINEVRARSIKSDAHMTVTDVIVDNSTNAYDRGYSFHPEVEGDANYYELTDAKGGSGLRLRVTADRQNYGRVKFGILDGGSGYTDRPSITVQDKKATWESGKSFPYREFCSVLTYNLTESTDDNGDLVYDTTWYVNMYENTGDDGYTLATNAPEFTDNDLYTDDELIANFGILWNYEGRWELDAPGVHTKIGMSEDPDVAYYVSTSDQE
ncbi:MAG: RagB/SusD family nutrient uptake outer membrane protein, partial [Rikenellaceae bacterium]